MTTKPKASGGVCKEGTAQFKNAQQEGKGQNRRPRSWRDLAPSQLQLQLLPLVLAEVFYFSGSRANRCANSAV